MTLFKFLYVICNIHGAQHVSFGCNGIELVRRIWYSCWLEWMQLKICCFDLAFNIIFIYVYIFLILFHSFSARLLIHFIYLLLHMEPNRMCTFCSLHIPFRPVHRRAFTLNSFWKCCHKFLMKSIDIDVITFIHTTLPM